jgi:hypothetical protein
MAKMYISLILILLIFILITSFLLFNSNIKENFSLDGSLLTDTSGLTVGNNGIPNINKNFTQGDEGNRCRNSLGWGIYNSTGECIVGKGPTNLDTDIEKISQSDNLEGELNFINNLDNENNFSETDGDYSECMSNNLNFEAYCRSQNPSYGLKSVKRCTDNTKSKVICNPDYINQVFYGTNTIITDCLNKSDDFDTWCRFSSDKSSIPPGFNINSIGSTKLLVGDQGGCFLSNGNPDYRKARAICDYNNMEQLPKIQNENTHINDYNKFTSCLPNNSNFLTACSEILREPNIDKVIADEIMGYDCNPNYFRAKCYKSKDFNENTKIFDDLFKPKRTGFRSSKTPTEEECCLESFIGENINDDLMNSKKKLNYKRFGIKKEEEIILNNNETNNEINNVINNNISKDQENIENKIYSRLVDNIKNIVINNKTNESNKNIWTYKLSNDKWFTIQQNNYICKWEDLNIKSNSNMSITFLLEITNISNIDRNILHFTNNNENCCNKGNRVPGIWILQNGTTLFISNDTESNSNETFIIEDLPFKKQIFITITWDGKLVYVYLNKNFIKSFTYPCNLISTLPETLFYIGDPWSEQNNGIKIKNLRLYDYVLNIKELQEIYNNEIMINNFWKYKISLNDWYTITQNNYIGKWEDLSINNNNSMSISFNLLILDIHDSIRNIFHVSNYNKDCCNPGTRIPGIWVSPNSPNLEIIADTQKNNDNSVSLNNLKLNLPNFITIIFDNNIIKCYIDGKFNNIKELDSKIINAVNNASVYIGNPWSYQNNSLKIKDFVIYNNVLSDNQVKNIYNNNKIF